MGVVDSIKNSKSDSVKPNKKSYWGVDLSVSLMDIKEFVSKRDFFPSEKRAMIHELSGKEPIKQIVVIKNLRKKMGNLTTYQMKEILADIGFNVDPLFSKNNYCDLEAVMNVGGIAIPGWIRIVRIISKIFPSREKMLLLKLSPGKDRLHIRLFENNDGTWIIAAHTDHNWLSLNLAKVYKSHVGYGAGDFITGTIVFYGLLNKFNASLKANKILSYKEVEKIINRSYTQSVEQKFKLALDI